MDILKVTLKAILEIIFRVVLYSVMIKYVIHAYKNVERTHLQIFLDFFKIKKFRNKDEMEEG